MTTAAFCEAIAVLALAGCGVLFVIGVILDLVRHVKTRQN